MGVTQDTGGQAPTGTVGGGQYGPTIREIPGTGQVYELWLIGGQQYLVYWIVDPTGATRFPLAYQLAPGELQAVFGSPTNATWPKMGQSVTGMDRFETMGGIVGGNVSELNNAEDDPITAMTDYFRDNYSGYTDPDFLAVLAEGWLEGRQVTDAELATNSPWYAGRTDAERGWFNLLNTYPGDAQRLLEDNRISVEQMLSNAGIFQAPEALVNLIADQFSHGTWSEVYLARQIELVADPRAQGDRDPLILEWQTQGENLDTTISRRERVKELLNTWLGPQLGDWSPRRIDQWASRLREEADAEDELINVLRRQRSILLPEYDNPALTYEDIASPFKSLWETTWGQPADEMDPLFISVLQSGDYATAGQLLRKEGLSRGVKYVQDSLLGDMVRSAGSTTVRAL